LVKKIVELFLINIKLKIETTNGKLSFLATKGKLKMRESTVFYCEGV